MAVSRSMKCNKCGYELLGLPNRGTCPECGAPFNKELRQGVTDPLDGSQSDRVMRRVRTISLVVLAVLVMSCGGIVRLAFPTSNAVWVGMLVGAVVVLGAVVSYLYETDG